MKKISTTDWSIQSLVALILAGATVAIALVAGEVVRNLETRYYLANLEQESRQILQLLEAAGLEALITRDTPLLNTITRESGSRAPDIQEVLISDRDGKPISHWRRNGKNPDVRSVAYDHQVNFAGEPFGTIHIHRELGAAYRDIQSHVQRIWLTVALAMLALSVLILLLLQWVAIGPLGLIHRELQASSAPEQPLPQLGAAAKSRELAGIVEAVHAFASTRAELERQRGEARYHALLDAAPFPILIARFDDGRIRYRNRQAEIYFAGNRGDGILGLRIADILADPADQRSLWRALEGGGTFETELHLRRTGGGADAQAQVAIAPIEFEGEQALILALSDITERVRMEAEWRAAKEQAESASRAKSTFLANMSHELRTPLNAVIGFGQILARDTSLPEAQRSHALGIIHSGDHLLSLITDILDLARIEAGRFEPYPSDWETHPLFREISNILKVHCESKNLRFRYESDGSLPDLLHCDAKRLRQILMNLLGNALKFTASGGITLRTRYRLNRLTLEVQDTGIGIPAAEIERVFEPFQQTGGSDSRAQGTGLGLTITRNLVAAMGGEMEVESTPGQGSTFRVHIPAEAVAGVGGEERRGFAEGIAGYRRTRGEGPFRVLVTDDDALNRLVIRGLLEPLGFAIAVAGDGRACLELVPQWHPDLILMDLRMPVMDGLEAARALRGAPETAQIPILAASASAFPSDREECLAAGCDMHLAKPIHVDLLLEALGALLPLEWVRETPVEPPPEPAAGSLPPAQVERLLQLARIGDVAGLERLVAELKRDDAGNGLIRQIERRVRNFNMAELVRLAKGLRPQASDPEESR